MMTKVIATKGSERMILLKQKCDLSHTLTRSSAIAELPRDALQYYTAATADWPWPS